MVTTSPFIINLTFFAAATLYGKLVGGNQAAIFYTSVTVAFSTFIGIIIYHVFQCLRDSRVWRNLVRKRNEGRRAGDNVWRRVDAPADEEMEEMLPKLHQQQHTLTYLQKKEEKCAQSHLHNHQQTPQT